MIPAEHLAVMGIATEIIPDHWTRNMVKSLAGNAMHFTAVSAVILFGLMNVRRADAGADD